MTNFRLHRTHLGRRNSSHADRLHPHPEQVAAFRSGVGGAWPYGTRGGAVRGLGAQEDRVASRRDAGSRAPARAHAADLHGDPGEAKGTVLLYGHLDKQPEMVGWAEGTGPWTPVMKDDKLYGRGGADDGYAMFASLAAILSLREEKKTCALRDLHRGVRRIGQLRPAVLYRSSERAHRHASIWSCVSTPVAAITISCG